MQLHDRQRDRGVRFVSISLDDRTDEGALDQARAFLIRQKATFENYLLDENVTDAFEMLDLKSIPAVFIYGRDGKLIHRLTADDPNRQFTNRDVDAALEGLLQSELPPAELGRVAPPKAVAYLNPLPFLLHAGEEL